MDDLSPNTFSAISIAVTAAVGALTAGVGWFAAKRTLERKRLAYWLEMTPLLQGAVGTERERLRVEWDGEELPDPVLLSLDITNTGNVALEAPPLKVKAVGATYVIPGFFENAPDGYEDLWDLERTDAEEVTIHLQHINPRQTASIRLFLDELPSTPPKVICAMPNLEIVRASRVQVELRTVLLEVLLASMPMAPALATLTIGRKRS